MSNSNIISIKPLGFQWETDDPFLFCAHHNDQYPAGNIQMEAPEQQLKGRNIGNDFTVKDGWRMYHGTKVPGFPAHPHRGFETVTIVLEGLVDHADSNLAAGRYGNGDVQWMTAGAGLQHAEMFPLINQKSENKLELFQVWLNLPKAKKFATPFFKMLWAEEIPKISEKGTEITLIAGVYKQTSAIAPAPDSWAFNTENEVNIWLVKMQPNAVWKIPASVKATNRAVYFYRGSSIKVDGTEVKNYHKVQLNWANEIEVKNSDDTGYILFMQGKPIAEPVVQYGPFVMNTPEEIQQAIYDFRRTGFGGWNWNRFDPVHPIEVGRFAKYVDGTEIYK